MTVLKDTNAPVNDRGEAHHQERGGSPSGVASRLALAPDTAPADTRPALTGYAVLVEVPGAPEPRYRRRLFLSLHSAQKAIERAEARGLEAHMVLLHMQPVGGGRHG